MLSPASSLPCHTKSHQIQLTLSFLLWIIFWSLQQDEILTSLNLLFIYTFLVVILACLICINTNSSAVSKFLKSRIVLPTSLLEQDILCLIDGAASINCWINNDYHMIWYKIYSYEWKLRYAYSSVLAWRIPGTGEPGGLPSVGSHRVGHDWSDLAAVAACVYTYIYVKSFRAEDFGL